MADQNQRPGEGNQETGSEGQAPQQQPWQSPLGQPSQHDPADQGQQSRPQPGQPVVPPYQPYPGGDQQGFQPQAPSGPATSYAQQMPAHPPVQTATTAKKPFYNRVWFWLIILAVVVVCYVATSGQGGSKTPSAFPGSSASQNKPGAKVTLDSISAAYTGDTKEGTQVNDQNTGVTVSAKYSDGTTKTITKGWRITNPGPLAMGQDTTFTVEYNGKTARFTARANPPVEYANALAKARSYSDDMHMSKQRIYDQLTSQYGEKFPAEAAQYAVDHLQADYNANALAKAKSYQKDMNMSADAIRDQLTSQYGEKFTQDEANYAIQHLND